MVIKYVDEYRDIEKCRSMSGRIRGISTKRMNIMEVCGGHTMAIRKNGLHKMVGDNIRYLSGPGCPVCVTSIRDIDRVIALSRLSDTAICIFGDLFYVPGTDSSLARLKAEGADIRVVYSVTDALSYAGEEPGKKFVFISIGFETTTPTIAAAVIRARDAGLDNLYVVALNKTMPMALRAVLSHKNADIDALILPGHVSAITGMEMYRFLVDEFNVSCAVSGFEPLDILRATYQLAEMREKGKTSLVNAYERAVRTDGNPKAMEIMNDVFEPCDAEWRGIGNIPSSGLKLRDKYSAFDAGRVFDLEVPVGKDVTGCLCGDILVGHKEPGDCPLFGTVCTPSDPKGACMVSSEGACAAWFRYGG